MAGGGGGETSLEYTPTWVVALVCTVIVALSLAAERIIHFAGKYLLRKSQRPLYEALLKIKEELMLLGFISLLLAVFQERIITICIEKHLTDDWLPCKKKYDDNDDAEPKSKAHFLVGRYLLAAGGNGDSCEKQGKAPLLSLKALHHLHIFIFVLAVSHVVFSVLTMIFGGIQIRQWKPWEDSIQKVESTREESNQSQDPSAKLTHVQEHSFVKGRFLGIGKRSTLLSWVHSFFKQFYGSVNESDYTTLRRGFIMTHGGGNRKFNFYRFMIRALEADFKKVVGISWYLWIFVVVFLLLNVQGWHAYFWIAFVPFILLLAVGTKLEHVITELAEAVARRHTAVAGELVVNPSNEHFWFNSPSLILILIHLILFQNSFEIAFFFWLWAQYGFDSCIMGQVGFIVPRLVIGVFVQFFCSYSTLPLYAIVTQMGSSFKKEVFEPDVQASLEGWAQKARRRVAGGGSTEAGHRAPSPPPTIQMAETGDVQLAMEEGKAGELKPEYHSSTPQ